MRSHLRPTATIATDAVLTGDPKRAMEIASELLERPLMSNLSRGLWGYHGTTATGHELTVQSTGIGGPSAAVVLAELAELGVRRAVRVGACTALDAQLEPGTVLVAERALAEDGASSRLAEHGLAAADPKLTRALAAALGASTKLVASTDLHYDPDAATRRASWRSRGAAAVDLSAAAMFAVGARVRIALACALVVAEAEAKALDEALLDERLLDAARAAATVLADSAQSSSPATPRLP